MAKIIGEAGIRLRAESKSLASEIRGLVVTAIKKATADIKPDTDKVTDGIREGAEKTSRSVRSIIAGLASSLLTVGSGLAQATLKAVKFTVMAGSMASTLAGLLPIIGGLGQAISGFGAAAIGVGVAGLTAMIALSATLKIATSGVGEAMKAAASGDAAALQEALKGLAPAARSFVTETAKLKPMFDDIKLATQAALFKGLGAEVLATGKALGSTFKGLFVGIATQVNEAGTQVLKFLREARTVGDLKEISENVTGGFREMSQAGRSIVQVIVDIVKSASQLLPGLGQSIEELTKRFAAFIRLKADSGELTEFFRQGIETVKQFGRILRDLGVGIANVFQIGSDAGGGFLGIIERVAAGFRAFTESLAGQTILSTIFTMINQVADAFGGFLKALSPLLPVLGQLARVVGDSVIKILDQLGPILEEVGRAVINALIETLPIVVPIVVKLAEAFGRIIKAIAPLIPALAKVLEALTPLIDPFVRLVEAILPPLISIIEDLTPVIKFLAEGLGLIVDVIGAVVRGFSNLGDVFDLILNPMDTVRKAIGLITGDLSAFGGGVKKGFRQVGHDAMKAIEEGLDGRKPSVLSTVSGAIDELVSQATYGASAADVSGMSFMDAVNRGMSTQESALKATIDRIMAAIIGLITGKSPEFQNQGVSLSRAMGTGLTQGQQEVIDKVRAVIQNLLDIISGRKSAFEQEGRNIANRLGGGIAGNQGDPVGAARSVGSAIIDTFSGSSLFSAGAAIMASLRSGLISGIQAVKNVLTSMTSLIPTWKGPESLDRKLLVPAGEAIMGGLIRSIAAAIPQLRSTLALVTDEVAAALNPLNGTSFDFVPGVAVGRPGDVAGPGSFALYQTNIMQPGADIQQFSNEVWRRGAQDLASGNSTLNVAQQPVQLGMVAPGSVVHLGA